MLETARAPKGSCKRSLLPKSGLFVEVTCSRVIISNLAQGALTYISDLSRSVGLIGVHLRGPKKSMSYSGYSGN
jgi:hypothetical protein